MGLLWLQKMLEGFNTILIFFIETKKRNSVREEFSKGFSTIQIIFLFILEIFF